jgi:molybdenum-dependent DNA-binding transcriptional regulator ModE
MNSRDLITRVRDILDAVDVHTTAEGAKVSVTIPTNLARMLVDEYEAALTTVDALTAENDDFRAAMDEYEAHIRNIEIELEQLKAKGTE